MVMMTKRILKAYFENKNNMQIQPLEIEIPDNLGPLIRTMIVREKTEYIVE